MHAALPPRFGGGEVGREVTVVLRVPELVVHPVEDAEEIRRPVAEQTVQPVAELRGLDLLGVGRRDRGQDIGVADPGLEQVEPVVVLETGAVELLPAEQGVLDLLLGEDPLVGQVVDREHAPGIGEEAVALEGVEIDRRQRRRPIVGVDHIGLPLEHLGQLEGAAATAA